MFVPIQHGIVNSGAERKTSRLTNTKTSSTQYVGSDGDQSVIFVTLLSRNMQIPNIFQD